MYFIWLWKLHSSILTWQNLGAVKQEEDVMRNSLFFTSGPTWIVSIEQYSVTTWLLPPPCMDLLQCRASEIEIFQYLLSGESTPNKSSTIIRWEIRDLPLDCWNYWCVSPTIKSCSWKKNCSLHQQLLPELSYLVGGGAGGTNTVWLSLSTQYWPSTENEIFWCSLAAKLTRIVFLPQGAGGDGNCHSTLLPSPLEQLFYKAELWVEKYSPWLQCHGLPGLLLNFHRFSWINTSEFVVCPLINLQRFWMIIFANSAQLNRWLFVRDFPSSIFCQLFTTCLCTLFNFIVLWDSKKPYFFLTSLSVGCLSFLQI